MHWTWATISSCHCRTRVWSWIGGQVSDDSVCSRDSSCGLFERLHRNEGQCWMFIVFVHRNMVRVSTYSAKTFRQDRWTTGRAHCVIKEVAHVLRRSRSITILGRDMIHKSCARLYFGFELLFEGVPSENDIVCRRLYKLPLYKLPLLERDTLMWSCFHL